MPETEQRHTEVVSVRLTPAQRGQLVDRAHMCGRPLSVYIRELALGRVPRARPGRLERDAIYHLGRLGNHLNQLARLANTTGRTEESDLLAQVLGELLAALRRLA